MRRLDSLPLHFSSQVSFSVVAYEPLRISLVERILVQPDFYSAVARFAYYFIVPNEVPGKLTKLIEYVWGY
jgi:hypothetical protein